MRPRAGSHSAAQGFADPRPKGRVDRRHLRRVLDRIGLIQIDSVNVLVRSQELPLFARLGPHPHTLIPDATTTGELFEYWVHEASHVDMAHYQLHRWRMAQRAQVVALLHADRTPSAATSRRSTAASRSTARCVAGDLSERVSKKGTWWDWDDAKVALEHLFWKGRVTVPRRASDFARIYDLTERVIPAEVLARPEVPEREARKQLLELAARHHGIGTFTDLTDYHRQSNAPCKPLVAELVEEGVLSRRRSRGGRKPAYIHSDARRASTIAACALLSPFDPVVWNRDRANRLFGFHYRIEIYTPQPKRIYGYYVLPILWGDSVVGRLDMKADRQRGALLVQGSFTEPGVPAGPLAEDLAPELHAMAGWLELGEVEVVQRGDLASTLRDAVGRYARR